MKAAAPTPWSPSCTGALGARCLAVARAAAVDVCAAARGWPAEIGLVGGLAGAGLVAHEVGHAVADEALIDEGRRLVSDAIDGVADAEPLPMLHYGFPGVAWAAQRVLPEPLRPDLDDVDDALVELVEGSWSRDFDLLRGLTGLGVYALGRLPHPAAVRIAGAVVRHLGATATTVSHGVTWQTQPRWLLSEMRSLFPTGYQSLGAAHGVPSVIAFLALAARARIEGERAAGLARAAIAWLLAQRRDVRGSSFPAFVGDGIVWQPARSAWCYGEPGIAAALLVAAHALEDRALEATAIEIGLRAAERPAPETGVRDAGLCHGAAGLALIYQRLHVATGLERFAEAARQWYEETLAMCHPGSGLGGFLALAGDVERPRWEANHTLLAGSGGIALALVAGASERTPEWDSLLLLSAPRPA